MRGELQFHGLHGGLRLLKALHRLPRLHHRPRRRSLSRPGRLGRGLGQKLDGFHVALLGLQPNLLLQLHLRVKSRQNQTADRRHVSFDIV